MTNAPEQFDLVSRRLTHTEIAGTAALLTVTEVANFLQVNRRTVLDLIASGDLRAINVGGARSHGARWRIGRRDLMRFVDSRASQAS